MSGRRCLTKYPRLDTFVWFLGFGAVLSLGIELGLLCCVFVLLLSNGKYLARCSNLTQLDTYIGQATFDRVFSNYYCIPKGNFTVVAYRKLLFSQSRTIGEFWTLSLLNPMILPKLEYKRWSASSIISFQSWIRVEIPFANSYIIFWAKALTLNLGLADVLNRTRHGLERTVFKHKGIDSRRNSSEGKLILLIDWTWGVEGTDWHLSVATG